MKNQKATAKCEQTEWIVSKGTNFDIFLYLLIVCIYFAT